MRLDDVDTSLDSGRLSGLGLEHFQCRRKPVCRCRCQLGVLVSNLLDVHCCCSIDAVGNQVCLVLEFEGMAILPEEFVHFGRFLGADLLRTLGQGVASQFLMLGPAKERAENENQHCMIQNARW